MWQRIYRSFSARIILALVAGLALVLTVSSYLTVQRGRVMLRQAALDKAGAFAITGAEAMGQMLQEALEEGRNTREELFKPQYRRITEGPLAGTSIPKYHTAYDGYLDQRIPSFLDAYLHDPSVVYAVLVDRNGYLPTHNTIYSQALTGDDEKDRVGNRTKRIFDDAVGLAAAAFDGSDGRRFLQQVYERDTGETMWDVSAPVFVDGEHWGSFRIGLSMSAVERGLEPIRKEVAFARTFVFGLSTLIIYLVVVRSSRPLREIAILADDISAGRYDGTIDIERQDELGRLVAAFNAMLTDLRATTVSKSYLREILDSMLDSLAVTSPSGRILKVNRATCTVLGYREDELLDQPLSKIFLEAPPKGDWCDQLDSAQRSDVGKKFLVTKEGRRIPVYVSSSELASPRTADAQMVMVFKDLSCQEIAEHALIESNRLLETVLNAMGDAISIIDVHSFQLLGGNQAFLSKYGLSAEEGLKKKCFEVCHRSIVPCDQEEAVSDCPIKGVLATKEAAECEHRHSASGGEILCFEIKAFPIKNEAGEVIQVVHVERDISHRRRNEQALLQFAEEQERANQELARKGAQLEEAYAELKRTQSQILQQEKMASVGQLAAGVAHEINNPIGFITSNLRSLGKYVERLDSFIQVQDEALQGVPDPQVRAAVAEARKKGKIAHLLEDGPSLIEESLEGAERVKTIVQNLKTFSRVDDSGAKMTNLNECLESTINIAWNEIKYKATLHREFGELPLTRCYPQQLNQVFMNILINAAHAIQTQGEITVKTSCEEGYIVAAISDTGCGIPPENLSRIFEPFFTTKEVGKGTGLGMSISYEIIKKHKGEIRVESEVGRGTTFVVRVPVVDEEAGAAPG